MVIDASALIAWLEGEPRADEVESCLLEADTLRISAATVVEAGIVVEARRGEPAGRELDLALHRLQVEIVPVDADQAENARAAYRRFGRGHHPAALNFGDYFSYALAVGVGEPLLFIGDDFAKTDVVAAM